MDDTIYIDSRNPRIAEYLLYHFKSAVSPELCELPDGAVMAIHGHLRSRWVIFNWLMHGQYRRKAKDFSWAFFSPTVRSPWGTAPDTACAIVEHLDVHPRMLQFRYAKFMAYEIGVSNRIPIGKLRDLGTYLTDSGVLHNVGSLVSSVRYIQAERREEYRSRKLFKDALAEITNISTWAE